MDKKKYLPRLIDSTIDKYLDTIGAVCIEGPKWCGKTWTSSFHSKSEFLVGNPEGNFQNRRLAEMSPALILPGDTPRLIDEWQEVTSIWDAVRFEVDQRGKNGQFILTGSSTPKHKGIVHSGAGRIARLRMQPMSMFEAGRSTGDISLKDICKGRITQKLTGEVKLSDLADCIVRGGWPGNQATPADKAGLIPAEYIKAITEDDVYRIDGVQRDKSKIMLLLRSLARNEATTASNRTLLTDIRDIDDETLDYKTVVSYLDIFLRLFLIENQQPFSSNVRSSIRVKQSEKRHFVDPSLASSLLGMNQDRLIGDLNTFGFLFEALVERDLRIYAKTFDGKLFHYQDYNNNEIDAIVEMPDGEWTAFEIKLGANQIDAAAAGLLKIRDAIAAEKSGRPPANLCVICGMSNAAYQRPDGVFVVPVTALRN